MRFPTMSAARLLSAFMITALVACGGDPTPTPPEQEADVTSADTEGSVLPQGDVSSPDDIDEDSAAPPEDTAPSLDVPVSEDDVQVTPEDSNVEEDVSLPDLPPTEEDSVDAGETEDAGPPPPEDSVESDVEPEDTGGPTGPVPAKGDLVITEIMFNPTGISDANGEWLEIVNVSATAASLASCVLSDVSGDSLPLSETLGDHVIPPGAYWLLAANADTEVNGGLTPNLSYDGFFLSNSEDEVILTCGGATVDAVTYNADTWPMAPGRSLSLSGEAALDEASNDDPANWCAAPTPYTVNNYGSPGEANPVCPIPDDTVDACRFVTPDNLELLVGTPFSATALVYDEDITDQNPWADIHPDLSGDFGWGPTEADPLSSPELFEWLPMSPSLSWEDTEEPGWDQYEISLDAPAAGSYQLLARFSLDGGETWTLCDRSGSDDGYSSEDAGTLTTGEDPCASSPCDSAPVATCSEDASEVITYLAPGTCTALGFDAECVYETEATSCGLLGGTCSEGACVDLAPMPTPNTPKTDRWVSNIGRMTSPNHAKPATSQS